MKKLKYFQVIVISMIFINFTVHASIENDLKNFFNKASIRINLDTPGVYQDQAAGYYTGGSLMARNAIRNSQLATIQMPGFRAGCGGIDAWTGGFSHIKAQELVNMLRSIGSSALTYAFLLKLETISPQIYNLVNELNAIATKVNNLNINSCEVAATMLGGLWPKSDQSSKHLCQAMGTELGAFSDWAAARQGCGAKGERNSVLSRKSSNLQYKDLLIGEFNLTWKALKLHDFLGSDQELAELFMTLVGSIISKKNSADPNATYTAKILPGHADRDDVLTGLLDGGRTTIYKCDSADQCLNPATTAYLEISQNNALRRKVRATLESLVEKVYEDKAITREEQDFLNGTRVPVYKMLNVTTAYRKGSAPLDLTHYADLIALDLLYKYIVEVIDLVHDGVAQLKAVQVNDADVEVFLKQLRVARERITVKRSSAFQQMDNILSLVQSTQLIEKQLHVMLGGVANDHNWF